MAFRKHRTGADAGSELQPEDLGPKEAEAAGVPTYPLSQICEARFAWKNGAENVSAQ